MTDAPHGKMIAFPGARAAGAALMERLSDAKAALGQVPVNEVAHSVSDSARRRADLAVVYAGVLGREVLPIDLIEALAADNPDQVRRGGKVSLHALAQALGRHGIAARAVQEPRIGPDLWPAMVQMQHGSLVLVLGQTGDALTIYDATRSDNRAEVPLTEFVPHYAGQVLRAEVSVAQLAEKHGQIKGKAHWFWSEFAAHRRHIAEIMVGSFTANMLAVAVALFSLQVYDRVIPHQSTATLWVLALGAVLAISFETLIKIARSRLMDGAGRSIELSVQTRLMQRLLGRAPTAAQSSPSETFSAMREFGSVREFFTASTIGTLADVPFIFLFLLLVASIAGNVVWVLVLGGILMILPGFFLQKKMLALTQETQGASVKSSRLLHETIYDFETVKTQRADDKIARTWAELTTLTALKTSEQRKLASALTFWSQGVQQATYIGAVIAGTFLVFAGEFTVGSIIAVGILCSRTLAPLTQLAGTMARWSNVKTALTALDAIAEAPQDYADDRTHLRRETLEGAFELRGVSFRYEQDGPLTLDIPGVAIKSGQRVAVLGANGSGKTSLLKLLTGLTVPTSGHVLVDGVDLAQIDPRDLRRNIGYLGQEVRLFAGTLRENLNLTQLERDDARLFAALDFAGLGPFVRGHHKGLDLDIRDGGAGLSVGQRQSLGWARLWLQDPRICLLDEPTAALDQTLEATLVSRLETWLQGRTVVIATHRVPILALTERTLIMQNGRMAIDGPREQVMAHLRKGEAV
ncbi:MAG: ATP-binding cassette domain-containing protein [Pseudomonadota bacterium]